MDVIPTTPLQPHAHSILPTRADEDPFLVTGRPMMEIWLQRDERVSTSGRGARRTGKTSSRPLGRFEATDPAWSPDGGRASPTPGRTGPRHLGDERRR